jgi:enoyl-CoA hydratase
MTDLVSYRFADGVATITMDDGKVNALSPAMLADINEALDRASADEGVVVVTGRAGIFSGGFDLKILRPAGPRPPACWKRASLSRYACSSIRPPW